MKRQTLLIILSLALLLLLAACAGSERFDPETGRKANFLHGLWHGIIAPISFIISLFNKTVRIYEINNIGWAYDLGFLIGIGGLGAGGGRMGYTSCSGKRAKAEDNTEENS